MGTTGDHPDKRTDKMEDEEKRREGVVGVIYRFKFRAHKKEGGGILGAKSAVEWIEGGNYPKLERERGDLNGDEDDNNNPFLRVSVMRNDTTEPLASKEKERI